MFRLGEKFLEWSDPQYQPSLEHIITTISFYWFTRCYPTSIWVYQWMIAEGQNIESGWAGIQCPLGYSWFKFDILNPPKQWRESTGIVKWFRDHERVGRPSSSCISISFALTESLGGPFRSIRAAQSPVGRCRRHDR